MAFENQQHCPHQNGMKLFEKKENSSSFHEILALPM